MREVNLGMLERQQEALFDEQLLLMVACMLQKGVFLILLVDMICAEGLPMRFGTSYGHYGRDNALSCMVCHVLHAPSSLSGGGRGGGGDEEKTTGVLECRRSCSPCNTPQSVKPWFPGGCTTHPMPCSRSQATHS